MHNTEKIEIIKKWLGLGSINIFGMPLSGKDTQCEALANLLEGEVIGSGRILRQNWQGYKDNKGKLAPTADFIDIVLPYLARPEIADRPLVLSSIGRWHGEELEVIKTLNQAGHTLKAVVYLKISERDAFDRLRQDTYKNREDRPDDTEETLRTVINEYKNNTTHVIDYYRNLGLLIEIDGQGPRDQITDNIIDALFELAKG
ncbi:MAG TPA: nucleoside monophosphate kinase [Candidatus Saccharimonadales bacterium]|nr:nucleoside monophosphate kinase [Candidatus Saccharimonadales bacterium]